MATSHNKPKAKGYKVKMISDLKMPHCSYGFRSGFAYATVDGQRMRIYTSQSDRTDYYEHCENVRAQFEAGAGEIVQDIQPA